MDAHFGAQYARSWSRDHVLAELGGITVDQALSGDWDTRDVWLAVWSHEGMPASER